MTIDVSSAVHDSLSDDSLSDAPCGSGCNRSAFRKAAPWSYNFSIIALNVKHINKCYLTWNDAQGKLGCYNSLRFFLACFTEFCVQRRLDHFADKLHAGSGQNAWIIIWISQVFNEPDVVLNLVGSRRSLHLRDIGFSDKLLKLFVSMTRNPTGEDERASY